MKKVCQPRILYLATLFFKNEGEIKILPNKQKLKQFIINKSALQEMLKRNKITYTVTQSIWINE